MLTAVKVRFGLALTVVLLLAALDLAFGQIEVSDCATCHRSIADEWRESLHSKSYSNPQFLADREKRVDPSCGCHAPDQLAPDSLGKAPSLRKDNHESGIDCRSCHLDTEMVIWSSGSKKFVPHWTHQSEIYSTGEFCAGCHSWAREDVSDCSICHMPSVEGPAADGPHLEAVPGATHLSHRWAGSTDPDLVGSAVSLEVNTVGEALDVELTNMVFAHKFPATDHRKVVLVLLEMENGQVLWEEPVAIPASSTVNFRIESSLAVDGGRLELRYYPAPEIGSEQFFVIGKHPLGE